MKQKLPHNAKAEQIVLGTALVVPEHFNIIEETLNPGDFFKPEHKLIFSAMIELFSSGAPPEVTQ